MKFRFALNNDLDSIESILEQSNLPHSDCQFHLDNFIVSESKGKIVGVGGFELYEAKALLRSVAVINEFRGQQIGDTLCSKLINRARSLGVEEMYLLTETAEKYFKNKGFQTLNREYTPDIIKQTRQFSGLCPSTATLMKLELN